MERSNANLRFVALAIWLLAQVAALGACAGRISFWRRSPAASEQLALGVMLCAQIGISALIFPYLLGVRSATVLAIVTGWPMAQLAAYLSDSSMGQAAAGELYVSAWLIGLFFLTRLLRGETAMLIGAAAGAMIALGGPVAWYLRMEFSAGGNAGLQWFGPMGGAISQISPGGSILAWTIPASLIAVGAAINFMIWKRRDNSRQVIH